MYKVKFSMVTKVKNKASEPLISAGINMSKPLVLLIKVGAIVVM
jgi:hypothetical protein